jgi:hypothetical protein
MQKNKIKYTKAQKLALKQQRVDNLRIVMSELLEDFRKNYYELSKAERWSIISTFGDYCVEYGRLCRSLGVA